ncbi:MAG: hypothetical protein ABDI20_01605 [Candidatus Bipolaricaulaceae bacterium]
MRMKWVPVVEKAKARAKAFGVQWLPILMAIIALLVLSSANNKWTG